MICKLKNTVLILSLIVFTTCIDNDYDKNYATFEEDTVTSFLEKDELYSEFLKIVRATGMADLLSAYGTYTCFAPTNSAIEAYYERKQTSFDQLTPEDKKEIVYNHLINVAIKSIDFPMGAISTANMDNKFLYITYGVGDNSTIIYVNDSTRILRLDQAVHNGIVHTVNGILEPSKSLLPDIIAQGRYSLFSQALTATGMMDSLLLVEDYSYEQYTVPSHMWAFTYLTPPFKKYGYTAFVESDSVYSANGIHSFDDLKAYAAGVYDRMYPENRNVTDITDRRNSLNRFVSYHLLDRLQADNEFINPMMEYCTVRGYPICEYIETMCPNTLMEVQTGNLFNKQKDGTAIRIISPNRSAANGLLHEIDRIMVYDETVENDVLNKRIRMDFSSMLPELASNKLRGNNNYGVDPHYYIPRDYTKFLTYNEAGQCRLSGYRDWWAYQGDEIVLDGIYDCTVRIPPIPPGRYEIRFCYQANPRRGVAQFYFDNYPCNIPLNMSIASSAPAVGWVSDESTEDDGIENDKMMRNRGYMKGPNTLLILSQTQTARQWSECTRKILLTKTFEKMTPHTLRIKSVEDVVQRELELDYMEFVPTTYLVTEGRD